MTERKRDPETGQFMKEVVTWETDWDLDEIKFKTPEGMATYVFAGNVGIKRDIREPTKTLRGQPTWHTTGVEEVFPEGTCLDCGKRLFKCTSHPIRADDEVGERVVHYRKSGPNEPPMTFCGDCIRKDPEVAAALDEAERQKARQKTDYELFLERRTAELGGRF